MRNKRDITFIENIDVISADEYLLSICKMLEAASESSEKQNIQKPASETDAA